MNGSPDEACASRYGVPGRTRTYDTLVNSQVLCY